MAVPDLIFRQKHLTAEHAMNVQAMLANFFICCHPKKFPQTSFKFVDGVTAKFAD